MADYTFYVKVANSKFVLDSVSQATIALGHGITYRFDQSDSSNSGHPLVFSTTSDGTHNSGSAYTTGVTTTGTAGSSGAYVDIAVTSSTPASLYYYCSNHSGMGSAVITTGNTHVTTNNLGLLLPILADATDQWGSHINQSLRKIEDTFGANADVYTYNITGDTTAITGSATAGGTLAFNDGQHIEVYLNGVKLVGNLSSGNDYTLNASTDTITLASNAVNGDVVNVVVFKTFQFADAVPATGGTFSGNVSFGDNNITNVGDIAVDTISSDSGTSIGVTLGTDAGDDFNVGSGKLVVEGDTGNVGVGRSDPQNELEVHNDTSNVGITISTDKVNGYSDLKLVNDAQTWLLRLDGSNDNLVLRDETSTSTALTIDSTGNNDVTVNTGNLVIGTAGKGITFQDATNDNTVSNQSHTLDQYETGDWTPVLTNGTSNAGLDSGTEAIYTRIGNCVFISGRVLGDGTTTMPSGNLRIEGLPFNSGNSTKYYNSISVSQCGGLNISASENIVMRTSFGTDRLVLVLWDSTAGTTNLQGSEFTNDGNMMFSGVYFVD